MDKKAALLIKRAKDMAAGGDTGRWKPKKKGDYVVGKVTSIQERTGDDDVFQVCFLKTDTGMTSFALGTVLRNLFQANDVSAGDNIAVVYQGEGKKAKKGFSAPKLYSIAIEGRDTQLGENKPKAKRRGKKARGSK